MDEEIRSAEAELAMASKSLGAPTGTNKGAEKAYGDAYQRLVRLGVRPQLRKKYRG